MQNVKSAIVRAAWITAVVMMSIDRAMRPVPWIPVHVPLGIPWGSRATYRAGVSPASSNAKTGRMAVTRHARGTCPDSCPLRDSGECYGRQGPCRWAWDDITLGAKGVGLQAYYRALAALPTGLPVRTCETGDQFPEWPGSPRISRPIMIETARALQQQGPRDAWSYTHYRVLGDDPDAAHNRVCLRRAARLGLHVRASCECEADARAIVDHGLRAALIVSSEYHRATVRDGRAVRWAETLQEYRARAARLPRLPGPLCPAAYMDIQCIGCRGCARGVPIMCLSAHGAAVARVDRRVKQASEV